ncbi:DNA-formamidopyrimidine glycosylase family protein [Compostimonas suwonensis]|uniref:DNA-(apurinic or apyrimidinic site) lyase n=1 Tax=Compostimonas suwonensis TaxID=1048394 RepID=A0A2M9C578_9MICO|nr:DNA-formamidopyrimidine glycosylase family protein [Compostimonas suwonensis]PJJ65666.1 endonuclease-8 [Compostimonas suwonensis]
MPEGDTVYRAARTLDEALAGQTLIVCDLRMPAVAAIDLSGEVVHEVVSRGKHLLMHIGAYTVHSHLAMEGSWHVYARGSRWRRPAWQARAVLETAERVAVGFDLAALDVVPTAGESSVVGHLGPDLLGARWDAAEAVRRLEARPEVPFAVAMLDQRNLAGLGNVYANELGFLRGILPTRPLGEVPDVAACVDLAHRLITANRDRAARTTTGDTRPGRRTWVYGREGRPCLRCGTPIERSALGATALTERDTFFCPRCQA